MANKRNRAAAWACRVCLLVALFAAASGESSVSAEPSAHTAGGASIALSEAIASRTIGIAAQDSWLGE